MTNDNKRFLLAIALSAMILFGWQFLFPQPKQASQAEATAPVVEKVVKTEEVKAAPAVPQTAQPLQDFLAQTDKTKFLIDNSLVIKDFISENQMHGFNETVGTEKPFIISVLEDGVYKPLFFNLKSEGTSLIMGQTPDQKLSFRAEIAENGKVKFSIQSAEPKRYRLQFPSKEEHLSNGQIRNFLVYTKDVERNTIGSDESGDGIAKWFGIDFNYHFFGVVLSEASALRYHADKAGMVTFDLVKPVSELRGDFVYLKKNYDDLITLGDNLQLTVDFGFFAIIAVPLLHIMQWLYHVIPNYGIAIIVLTLLMRLVLYPLQHKSAKSMKKMQKVQPELKRIQEKFKDDPQRVQKETMELFKRSGANPMGGCLPLILQMPIFFAIYRVLYSAVELVDAPFVGWIHDLSQKDPYYILPVLMTITMFLQQKVTPSASMDKNQQKMMMAMPIIFGFIMKDLPSGLVLYIFVSSLFGYVQQILTYRFSD